MVASAGMAVSLLLSEERPLELESDDLPEFLFTRRKNNPKSAEFVDIVVPVLTDVDFRSHFRLRRSDVEVLLLVNLYYNIPNSAVSNKL